VLFLVLYLAYWINSLIQPTTIQKRQQMVKLKLKRMLTVTLLNQLRIITKPIIATVLMKIIIIIIIIKKKIIAIMTIVILMALIVVKSRVAILIQVVKDKKN